MKAMLIRRFGPIEEDPLELVELPDPEPGPGEIRVRVNICGVCHTDLHTVEGELSAVSLPRIPGHQVVGRVDRRGEGAGRFRTGERVGLAWLHSTCGVCRFCRKEKENLCESARFTGHSVDGGYAEYVVIPEAFAYRIPGIFEDAEASPLLCAGIIGYRALHRSGIRPGERLGLYGFGASAHVAIQVAVHQGSEVYVFSRSEAHRRHAESLGAVWTGAPQDSPPKRLDAAVNFTPAGETVTAGMRHLEKGGTMALAGIYMSPIPQMDYEKDLYDERTLRSVANATRRDGEELLEIAAQIPIRTTTTPYSLDEANQALKDIKHSRIDGAAILRVSDG